MTGVSSAEEIICNLDQGRLSAVMDSINRMECFKELMVFDVLMKLCGDCFFQDFAEEREVGD